MERKKVQLELHFVGDGRIFLNYWDYRRGEDVVAEFIDGRLYDNEEEITLEEYIKRVDKVA